MADFVNHAEMVELLIEQYKTDPRLREFIVAALNQSGEIELASQDVAAARDVDQAEGAALDLLGQLVGIGRLGQTDEAYRVLIKGQIIVNRGNGRGSEFINLLELIVTEGTYAFSRNLPGLSAHPSL